MSCVIKWYLYFFNLGGNIGLVMVIFSIQSFPLLSYLMHVNSLNMLYGCQYQNVTLEFL